MTNQISNYVDDQRTLEAEAFRKDPDWAHLLRKKAIDSFMKCGFPTARRGNEEWKYTDIRPIAQTHFRPIQSVKHLSCDKSDIEEFMIGEADWHRLIFIDGLLDRRLSSHYDQNSGIKITSLADAIIDDPDLVEEHIANHANYPEHAFTALNTAFLHEGAVVYIPTGTVVDTPIHILFISTPQGNDTISHPRVLVVTGQGSRATIVESYCGQPGAKYLCNAVSEIIVGPDASLGHYRIQQHSEKAYHIGTSEVSVGRNSHLSSVTFDMGGGLVRNNLNVRMEHEGGNCTLNGAYMASNSQRVDNQITIDHIKSHTSSRELYKGVLGGKAKAVFHGSIIVRENAQKVDAKQEDKNILLSDESEVYVKPAFWIYADDVKCGHGAANGRLDQDTLFYLRSRGMNKENAQSLLIRGFLNQVIETISSNSIKTTIAALVDKKLQELLD